MKSSTKSRLCRREGGGSLQRTFCPYNTDKMHVCEPRCIFPDAHVAVENELKSIRASGRELCEALSTVCHALSAVRRGHGISFKAVS